MAELGIFVDTPSIFESLILKQFDLYFKIIITHVLLIDLSLLCFYFGAIEYSYEVTIVLALTRISALIGIFFGNALRYIYFGCTKIKEEFRDIFEFLQKGYQLCMN